MCGITLHPSSRKCSRTLRTLASSSASMWHDVLSPAGPPDIMSKPASPQSRRSKSAPRAGGCFRRSPGLHEASNELRRQIGWCSIVWPDECWQLVQFRAVSIRSRLPHGVRSSRRRNQTSQQMLKRQHSSRLQRGTVLQQILRPRRAAVACTASASSGFSTMVVTIPSDKGGQDDSMPEIGGSVGQHQPRPSGRSYTSRFSWPAISTLGRGAKAWRPSRRGSRPPRPLLAARLGRCRRMPGGIHHHRLSGRFLSV